MYKTQDFVNQRIASIFSAEMVTRVNFVRIAGHKMIRWDQNERFNLHDSLDREKEAVLSVVIFALVMSP